MPCAAVLCNTVRCCAVLCRAAGFAVYVFFYKFIIVTSAVSSTNLGSVLFYKLILITSAVSSTNLGATLIAYCYKA